MVLRFWDTEWGAFTQRLSSTRPTLTHSIINRTLRTTTFYSLHSRWDFLPHWLLVRLYRWSGGKPWSLKGWYSSAWESYPALRFRCTIQQLPLCSVLWRAMLLELGIIYALVWFVADYHYTIGADQLRLVELETAARLFPFYHEYRIGPARLVIRDHDWERPDLAAAYLVRVMRHDPNSVFLSEWARTLNEKAQYDKKNVLIWPGWPPKL